MTQRKELLLLARTMATPITNIGIYKDFMSPETRERYEVLRRAFINMIDSANDDLVTEETMLSAARVLKGETD